ncbi:MULTISPECIES: hypothetical protein [Streptomycetaceae]|uniref:ATP-binding protein n=1 Tax=Streptantibioticus cattleyicolor (strain ATCC 35852 / DSM 46488 / JCM 4925 / NBRC 14057 / NRRL 8057) TaxID=1003195 RepID=F8K181_STREN|nr:MULTISPECIES: hypothetical protein [Streptomycetaceae]AEW96152.1 hypothetical protein SCATT_37810 [Streptantibioticus cattleyicolor NRRL 8057 = DSM 46488]MYS60679.1 hypothetical protein [Streptomyces sp. SID5468]CCB76490.1 Predicted protein [Streptantibioticus cattleyicolor NRRL 8057 = DSM 46488]
MKTGTIKTLGAAALGVAFAATAAGSANAAPLPLPAADPSSVLNTATKVLPVEKLTGAVPGAAEGTQAVRNVIGGTHTGPLGPSTLLGGLPTGALGPLSALGGLPGGLGH